MPPDIPWAPMLAATFFAALIQSTTGVGFGLIATPFLLMALDSGSAVGITIVLSLAMSVLLCLRSYQSCNARLVGLLAIGAAIGLPMGLLAFRSIETPKLKLLAGVAPWCTTQTGCSM